LHPPIEPASPNDLQAEVANYEAVLQQSLQELISHARNDVPSTKNGA
jgi:hypothetical protein